MHAIPGAPIHPPPPLPPTHTHRTDHTALTCVTGPNPGGVWDRTFVDLWLLASANVIVRFGYTSFIHAVDHRVLWPREADLNLDKRLRWPFANASVHGERDWAAIWLIDWSTHDLHRVLGAAGRR